MTETLRSFLDFAVETIYLAGRVTLGHFQTGLRPDMKSDDTPVTVADRQTEELIRARIEKAFPHHAIVGEEHGVKETANATHRWFIDPIDGTKAFVRGVPLYGVLLGLEIEGRVEVGVVHCPAVNEMLAAATGEGCWWNGRRARVSNVTNLKDALITCTDPASFAKNKRGAEWERLQQKSYARAGWSDAYGYLLVATGRAELMLDPIVNVWDLAPFPPIFREVGGYFGDWQGNETIYANEGIATTRALLPEVLRVIRGDPA